MALAAGEPAGCAGDRAAAAPRRRQINVMAIAGRAVEPAGSLLPIGRPIRQLIRMEIETPCALSCSELPGMSEAALSRDHEVTAVVRGRVDTSRLPAGVRTYLGDAGNSDDVARLSAAQDVAISATRPAPGSEQELRAGREPCAARRQRHGDVPHDLRGWWGSRWSCSRRPSPPSLAWPSSGIRTTDRARARICPHLDPTESRAFWRLPEP
jgi:hypothetical protein